MEAPSHCLALPRKLAAGIIAWINGMDELDRQIIALLQVDARVSNANIARELGVSSATVRQRLRVLIQDGAVRLVAIPNLDKLGYHVTALIGLHTRPGMSDSVAETIVSLEEVHYVAITTGSYDMFITQRLILQGRFEGEVAAQSVPDFGVGSGLVGTETGFRLRYEVRRKFAPYVGWRWERAYGKTADLARDAGTRIAGGYLVSGVRFWF